MRIVPIYRQEYLGEDAGYASTCEIIGYQVEDDQGRTLGIGECESEALENALEGGWHVR